MSNNGNVVQKTLFESINSDEIKTKPESTPDSVKSIFDEMQELIEKKEALMKHRKRKVKYD